MLIWSLWNKIALEILVVFFLVFFFLVCKFLSFVGGFYDMLLIDEMSPCKLQILFKVCSYYCFSRRFKRKKVKGGNEGSVVLLSVEGQVTPLTPAGLLAVLMQ